MVLFVHMRMHDNGAACTLCVRIASLPPFHNSVKNQPRSRLLAESSTGRKCVSRTECVQPSGCAGLYSSKMRA